MSKKEEYSDDFDMSLEFDRVHSIKHTFLGVWCLVGVMVFSVSLGVASSSGYNAGHTRGYEDAITRNIDLQRLDRELKDTGQQVDAVIEDLNRQLMGLYSDLD